MAWHRTDPSDVWGDLASDVGASITVEASEHFVNPCGFVKLRERHRVKAVRTITNSQDRHCRISKVKVK